MDEAVRKIAGVGLPGVILLIAMATTGFTGAAAITAALAMLGPGGMIGGIVFLGIIGLASDALAKYGLEALLKGVYLQRKSDGEPLSNLSREINSLPISLELKLIVKNAIGA
ncbi:MAG: hypothetical protein AAGJ08_04200 [Cyanobacteria bacterium P01_H01_bin.35]|uniref:hypothetical protein n=1 Tax=Okeania sp. SIO2B3 TaxID=2607784 RepID=UPI0013BFB351|nr:hypothetical protein [Okeania sp. SIO2B3]NET40734.1 hypothetical protein [Okeania sp. SIO2B3]